METGVEFRRFDRNDPTLAVDGLSDFWPAPSESDDMLSIGLPNEWFADRVPDAAAELFAADDVEVLPADDSLDCMSETQRAALEFQRFAEQFHAFATASASGECGCRPRR